MSQLARRTPALRREHVLCPITALSFYRAKNGRLFILSGEDSQLKVYDVESSELRATLPVFKNQSIHGILVRGPKESASPFDGSDVGVLIWGGASVTALSCTDIEGLVAGVSVDRPPVEVHAPDWIYDGVLSTSGGDLVGAVVTAHNEVMPLLLEPDSRTLSFGRLRSPSRPILFSAKLAWDTDGSLIVGAGTAFGEIVVWKCSLRDDDDDKIRDGCEITYVFSGHEGSIFGVDISPELTLPSGAKTRLLASCSDDRTIRIWDITELGKSGERKHTVEKTFGEARETGFGSICEDGAGSQHLSKPVAVVMSHISRIWHVKFAIDTPELHNDGGLVLYSFGEDATTQQWRLDLDNTRYSDYLQGKVLHGTVPEENKSLATLTQLALYHSHSGKHIWSTAIQTDGSRLVASGGADGLIDLIGNTRDEGSSQSDMEQAPLLSFSVQEVLQSLAPADTEGVSAPNGSIDVLVDSVTKLTKTKAPKRRKALVDCFNQYAFLSETQILATTLSGEILACCLEDDTVHWSTVELENNIREDMASWQVVRSIGSGIALVGSASGCVYLYDTRGLRKVAQVGGKVADMFHLLNAAGSTETELRALITVLGRTKATLLKVDLTLEPASFLETHVELDQGFIVTSAAFCRDYLVLGSRFGAILVYRRQQGGGFERIARVEGKSRDAVASLVSLPESPDPTPPYFLTTCRDGKYRIYEILNSSGIYNVQLRHETSPPLGPMIEGSLFAEGPNGEPHLILCGFRSKNFVVWNETTQQEIASVECGGAHRAFTYNIERKHPERLCFIWTKASQTCVHRQTFMSHRTLKAGGHGREIRPVSSCSKYLATGGEDTIIRIWKYQDDSHRAGKNNLNCLAVLEKHTTGIQSLKWFGDEYLLSSCGNEELFIWKITTLQSAYGGLAVVCEAVYPDLTPDGDLRIMNFDVEGVRDTDGGISTTCMYITLTLSNSTVKTYEYSKERGFKLLSKGQYTGACITQVRHLQMEEDGLHVLTAATDGHVAVWKTCRSSTAEVQGFDDYSLAATARIHQSTIKALDIRGIPSGAKSSFFVVTGGDDNAMGSFCLSWNANTETFAINDKLIVNSIHAAAVAGISVTKISASSAIVVTTSNDQRIKTWEIQLVRRIKRSVSLIGNEYSCVADTGDLEIMTTGYLVSVGVGMEFWKMEA